MYNPAYDGLNPDGPSENTDPGTSTTSPSYLTYELLYTDPSGKAVYRGSDGKMYTDGNGPNGFVPYSAPAATPTPDPPKPPLPTGGGGGGNLLSPFLGTFTPPTAQYPLVPNTPVFTPPGYTPPPAFEAPTGAEVLSDPGYQFSVDEGRHAIEAGKAAAGTLNTGGTLKDILAWGQNYATTRYGDVYNRKRDIYDTNYKTQYLDPYGFAYKGALDSFAPSMTAYTTQAAAGQRQNELDYTNAWQRFMFDYDKWRDQRDSTWNKNFQYTTA